MKRSHIASIVLIAVAIGAIIATTLNSSTYVDFDKAEANIGKQYTVIGQLNKEKEMNYSPRVNQFTFTAIDKKGNERLVIYNEPKPQDFERSEEITMTGYATDSAFVAEKILMKCPSKYNDNNEVASDNIYQ